jgi:hypothetical protein
VIDLVKEKAPISRGFASLVVRSSFWKEGLSRPRIHAGHIFALGKNGPDIASAIAVPIVEHTLDAGKHAFFDPRARNGNCADKFPARIIPAALFRAAICTVDKIYIDEHD